MFLFECPRCQSKLKTPDHFRGTKRACPACKNLVLIEPEPDVELPSLVDPASDSQVIDGQFHFDHSAEAPPPEIPPSPAPRRDYQPKQGDRSSSRGLANSAQSIGITSLVLGVLSFLVSMVPMLGLASIPIAVVGAILAFVSFSICIFHGSSEIGYSIGGGLRSVFALILAVWMAISVANAFRNLNDMQRIPFGRQLD